MNKSEYIARLAKGLEPYDIINKYDVLADYEQIVDEILLDNDDDFNYVIEKIGYPEILAMEIAEELGYKAFVDYKANVNNPGNRYNVKRQKSNVIWNILLAVFYFFQSIFALALVVVIIIALYMGIDGSISLNLKNDKNNINQTVRVCRTNMKCTKFDTQFAINSTTEKNYHLFNSNDNYNLVIPVGFVAITTGGILIVLLLLNKIIIYSNVRQIINSNNEYNRRRSYE